MIRYKVGEQTFAIIENELWVKAVRELPQVALAEVAISPDALSVKKKKGPKPKKEVATRRTRKGGVDPELKAVIYREFKDGATVAELVKKYQGRVSYGSVYLISKNGVALSGKNKNSGEPLKLSVTPKRYICTDGHHFETKLPLSHARCPRCHSPAESVDTERPVVETDVEDEAI